MRLVYGIVPRPLEDRRVRAIGADAVLVAGANPSVRRMIVLSVSAARLALGQQVMACRKWLRRYWCPWTVMVRSAIVRADRLAVCGQFVRQGAAYCRRRPRSGPGSVANRQSCRPRPWQAFRRDLPPPAGSPMLVETSWARTRSRSCWPMAADSDADRDHAAGVGIEGLRTVFVNSIRGVSRA